jgi:hypothetical protein
LFNFSIGSYTIPYIHFIKIISNLSIILLFSTSCGHSLKKQPLETQLTDGLYDSEFPGKPTSRDLNRIIKSIKLLSTFSVYKVYSYEENTPTVLILKNPEKYSYQTFIEEKPASGTAAVVYNHEGLIGLLTCAHIIDTPDTLIRYYDDDSTMIKSIHVLEKGTRLIIGMNEVKDFEIFAMDRKNDIALIGKRVDIEKSKQIPIFPFKTGKSADLDWGTFTYLLGYPKGKMMLSTAIISNPHCNNNRAFALDAALPRGISGGVVLALRDGPPNFELVGMINAVSSDMAKILVPDRRMNPKNYHPGRPYTGDIFAKIVPRISYGIEHAVTIDEILNFIKNNKNRLNKYGFKSNYFFRPNISKDE